MNKLKANIPENKKQQIIDAAIGEFADKGYEKASTNTIAGAAGIAKGSLFHYFGSKKKLFLWLVQYAVDIAIEHYKENLTNLDPDFSERLLRLSLEKLKFYQQYPQLSRFVFAAFLDPPREIKNDLQKLEKKLRTQNSGLIFKSLDLSNFRDDINKNQAMEMMIHCLEGLGNKYREKYQNDPQKLIEDFDLIVKEMNEYLELIKYGTYKHNK